MESIVIKLKDGSKVKIHNVEDYWVNYENRVAVVVKNGRNIPINFNEVIYIGWEKDLITTL